MYDDQNVFARILRGEISVDVVHETSHAMAFRDANPQAPIHVLVVPKGAYVSFDDFYGRASSEEVTGFFTAVGETAQKMDLSASGYRLIANHGKDAGQEVPHFHMHILGGARLGPLNAPRS